MMDLLLPAFQLLYFVAHFLVSLCQAVYDALLDLYRAARELIWWLFQAPSNGIFTPGKAPQHPVLLLLPGQYKSSQLHHVVKVLTALAQGGSSCLTVYEAVGKLRDQQWALQDLLQAALPGFNVHLIPDETAADSDIQQFGDRSHERRSVGEVLLLRVISLESGGRTLLRSVRHLARSAGPDRVVEVSCEALHGFLATPHCSSCWGSDDEKCLDSSLADDPLRLIGDGETCSDARGQLDGSDENADGKMGFEQTNRNSDVEDGLEVEKCVKNNTENSLQQGSAMVRNRKFIPQSKDGSSDNLDCYLEQSSKESIKSLDVGRSWCRFGGSLLPDPDLVLVVGEYLSSNGFPPWFLRLSEFVCTPRLHKIDQAELTRILRNYSKTEQRYGR